MPAVPASKGKVGQTMAILRPDFELAWVSTAWNGNGVVVTSAHVNTEHAAENRWVSMPSGTPRACVGPTSRAGG
jgi:hypothetical protein